MIVDRTEQNLETIRSLRVPDVEVEQMVDADRNAGEKVHLADGTWWREVKPFFYQTAHFMRQVQPGTAAPKPWLALGGYYHLTPADASANGQIVVNEIRDPSTYDLHQLRKTKRQQIRRGLVSLVITPVSRVDDLLGDGYQAYLDWESRTSGVRVKRSNPQCFRTWITALFEHPYSLILGAYWEGRVVAYIICRSVEGTADISKAFSHSSANALEPTSSLIYAYVRACGNTAGVRRACDGFRSLKPSLENYKAGLGFRHIAYPANIQLRPYLRPIARRWFRNEYRRLLGQYDEVAT